MLEKLNLLFCSTSKAKFWSKSSSFNLKELFKRKWNENEIQWWVIQSVGVKIISRPIIYSSFKVFIFSVLTENATF